MKQQENGDTAYYTENTFWITHIEIQTLTSLYIISAIVICLDYLKEYKNTYKILFCTIFILILSLYSFKGQLIYGYNNQKKIRTNMYICEKAYLYQYKNKLNPVVFPELEETDDWQHRRFIYMYKTIYNNESYNAKEYKSVLVPPEDFYEKMDKLGLDFKEIQTDKKLKFGDITKTLL